MIGDKNEMNRKVKMVCKAARKFQGCSYRLVDAAVALQKHEAGTDANRKAQERYALRDAQFDAADKALTEILLDMGE